MVQAWVSARKNPARSFRRKMRCTTRERGPGRTLILVLNSPNRPPRHHAVSPPMRQQSEDEALAANRSFLEVSSLFIRILVFGRHAAECSVPVH